LSESCRCCSSSRSSSGKITLGSSAIRQPQAIAIGTCPKNSLQDG
jgi:hypothetical protein